MMIRKTRVYLGDVEPFRSFEAYVRDGEHWNGWACPYFGREAADEVMAFMNEMFGSEDAPYGHIDSRMVIKRLDDPLVVTRYEITEQDEHVSEVWPSLVKYENQDVVTWPIGAFGWTWSEDEKNEKK